MATRSRTRTHSQCYWPHIPKTLGGRHSQDERDRASIQSSNQRQTNGCIWHRRALWRLPRLPLQVLGPEMIRSLGQKQLVKWQHLSSSQELWASATCHPVVENEQRRNTIKRSSNLEILCIIWSHFLQLGKISWSMRHQRILFHLQLQQDQQTSLGSRLACVEPPLSRSPHTGSLPQ